MPDIKPYPDAGRGTLLQGHMPEMQRDTYGFYLRRHHELGDSLKFRAFPGINFYSFASAEAVHHILITNRAKYSRGARWSRIVSYIGGNGIVTSTGDTWRKQRQAVTPYFQPAHVDKYISLMVRNTREVADRWAAMPAGTEINVSKEMMLLGLVNVSDILFNYDIRPHAARFGDAMMDGFQYINRFIQNPLTPPRFLPLAVNRNFSRDKAAADDVVREIIANVRDDKEDSMINALIRAGNSNRQLHDEIITLLMAGHDTLSTALAWAWRLLAAHQDVLARVMVELDAVAGTAPLTAEMLEKLVYTRMVFKETLRLYPSAWAIHRFAEEQDIVEGHVVRKGSSVVLPVYVTHRLAKYWRHPDSFYPEHFSKAESDTRPRFAYYPFGAGEHVCVGGHLATIEGVAILATLLQRFRPVVTDPAPVAPLVNFTLKPERNIFAQAQPR